MPQIEQLPFIFFSQLFWLAVVWFLPNTQQLLARWPNICVIIITGYPSLEDMRVTFKMKVFDYLAKPFSPREMVARVRAILRRANNAANAEPATGVAQVDDGVAGTKFSASARPKPRDQLKRLLMTTAAERPGMFCLDIAAEITASTF